MNEAGQRVGMRLSDRSARLWPTVAVGLFAYGIVLAKGGRVLEDPDTYWHIATGRWILAHGAIPHRDIFSYSDAGAPWVPHEWLADTILAGAYDRLGWTGLVFLTALTFALTLAFLFRALSTYLSPLHAFIGTLTALGMCFPHLWARPHVFTLPLLVVWIAALVAARNDRRAPRLLFALLMTPWANLHGGYIIGLGFVVLFAAEAIFDAANAAEALRAARQWAIFAVASLLAALLTPNGLDGLLLPFRFVQMDFALSVLNEWRSPNFQRPEVLEAWLLLLLLGTLSLGVRLPMTRIAMLLLLIHLALQHRRYAETLGLVAPLLMAPSAAPQLRTLALRLPERLSAARLPPGAWLGAALLMALIATASRIHVSRDGSLVTPAAAVAAVAGRHVPGPVFNELNFGGYLIFSGIAPFIDGRADMYGDAFLKRYADLDRLPQLLEQYRVGWTLVAPDSPRVAILDVLPGWQRLYSDQIAVVHVRTLADSRSPDSNQ